MKKLNAEWLLENWRWVLYFSLMAIVIPSLIYHLATLDPQLRNNESRKQVRENLEKEMKEISLPPKTAVNKFDSYDKHFSVFVETRYRTETDEQEFIKLLTTELQKKGWNYYGKSNLGDSLFCRGQSDAELFSEGKGGLFSDDGNYFKLNFTTGMRPLIDFGNSLPVDCK